MTALPLRIVPPVLIGRSRASRLVERNFQLYRQEWVVIISGFLEPLFYLLSIGVGIGKLVGHLHTGGHAISYTEFIAPAMLSASAMNGAVIDATFNVFFKLKISKLYDSVLATPVSVTDIASGETAWSVLRGALYAMAFLVVMAALGLVSSLWALVAFPAAMLVGFAFAACGIAMVSFFRSWQDFEYIQLALMPMFLFSGTFYPVSSYAAGIRVLVQLTPLYHAVAMERALVLGGPGWATLGHAGYLLAMGLVGGVVARRRLASLLLR